MKIGGDKVGITWNQTTEAVDEIILEIVKRIDSIMQDKYYRCNDCDNIALERLQEMLLK